MSGPSPTSVTRILIADDHAVLSVGVTLALEQHPRFRVVGTARDSTELFQRLAEVECDVVVTDYTMPGGKFGDGLAMLEALQRRAPHVRIAVLTMIDNPQVLSQIIKSGVRAVIAKQDDLTHLTKAVDALAQGGTYYSPAITERLEAASDRGAMVRMDLPLSTREAEVVRLLLSGLSVTEVAAQLHRSVKTISTQKGTAMRKLGLTSEAELFRYGLENGLIADVSRPSPSGA